METKEYEVIGWVFYDDDFPTFEGRTEKDELAARLAVIKEIRKHGYAFCGDSHLNREGCVPILSDGRAYRCSQRGWGAVMAEAWGVDNEDGYAYMTFYMEAYAEEGRPEGAREPKFPEPFFDEKMIVTGVGFSDEIPEGYEPYGTGPKDYFKMLEEVEELAKEINMLLLASPEDEEEHPLIVDMRLEEEYFDKIYSGEKTLEIRLLDEKRQRLAVGDTVQFICKNNAARHLRTEVTDLKFFPSFAALYRSPEFTRAGAGDVSEQEFVLSMREIYPQEKEEKYGVLAILFDVVSK